ncbi:ProQ/FINO family protein [Chromatium okenii]|nr:ProQ/FINO family protein [Chromatium okenii]
MNMESVDNLQVSVSNDEPEVQFVTVPPLDLPALYPACFDPNNPHPLKFGVHKDLVAAGYNRREVRLSLSMYCWQKGYLSSIQAGAMRTDLQGQPAGEVTEAEAAVAQAKLVNFKPVRFKPLAEPKPKLPRNAPLTEENIVSGRLELTVKFNELPKPVVIKSGMKIGIQTETALVVATLKPKAWKKLEKAQAEWSQWVASMTGKLGVQVNSNMGKIVTLENPALVVFEKKAKVNVTL